MSAQQLSPTWVTTPEQVTEVAEVCRDAGRLALDTEADSLYSFYHKVCLVQVSAGMQHFIIDPLAIENAGLEPLWQVAADPAMPVLMHGADYDLRVLDRDFTTRVHGLLDTQIMAQLLGFERTGLGSLLEQELGLQLDKRQQRANWGRRPLPGYLLQYASADTAHLEELVARLRHRLEQLGRWSWVLEDCLRLEEVRYTPPPPNPLAFERVKGARSLKGAARDRCYSLHQLRDTVAQELDLPPFKVLGNQQLLQLATSPPTDLRQLSAVKGVPHRLARHWGKQVISCLRHPQPAPPRAKRTPPPRRSAAVRARAKRLVEERDAVASELGLDPSVLCPKAQIHEIASQPNATSLNHLDSCGLHGWRLQVLGRRLLAACKE